MYNLPIWSPSADPRSDSGGSSVGSSNENSMPWWIDVFRSFVRPVYESAKC